MMRYLRQRPERRFASLAVLAAWLATASPWGMAQLVTASGLRLGVRAWVAGALAWLVPPPRVDGGFGVVASVDSATQVTLAAGYTLAAGGSVERWDISGSARLGLVEYSRSAAVVRLPDTTGLAAGDVLYDGTRCTSYTAVAALLTALGSGFDGGVELRNRTSGALIGTWGWSGAAIAPRGAINLAAVSTSQYGTAASAAGTGIVLASAAAWTPASGTLRAWSSAGEAGDSAYTRSGTTLTVTGALATAVAAEIAAGRTVTLWDVATELQVGGATREVRIGSGLARFSAGVLVTNGRARLYLGAGMRPVRCSFTPSRSAAADGQYAACGYGSGSKSVAVGVGRVGGSHYIRIVFGDPAAPTVGGTMIGGVAAFDGAIESVPTEYQGVANEVTGVLVRAGTIEAFCYATGGGGYAATPPDSLVVHAIPAAAETVTCLLTVARML